MKTDPSQLDRVIALATAVTIGLRAGKR